MNLELANKVVFVTGASSGIGRATALAFAEEGAAVAVGYHSRREEAAAVVVEALVRGASKAKAFALDLATPESLDAAVDDVHLELGPIQVLVNNAVSWPEWQAADELFETTPPQRFIESVTANLVGPYLLARRAVADMRAAGWGRIVHVSTGLVEDGSPANVAYGAAKSGLHGMTRFMSRELARAGIFTNVVMAGFTPADRPFPADMLELAANAAATKRVTAPADVARTIVFLCSAANSNTTGELVRVDGHFLAPLVTPPNPDDRERAGA
jgi:3-oxoacyl-[acyl-carrier protein] reductase